MKKTKLALFQSIVSLVLCVSMLVGTTFAWFTDSVTSAGNIIVTGKLDAGLEWADQDKTQWNDASQGVIFDYELWEPGYTQVRYLKVRNLGNLAFSYKLQIVPEQVLGGAAELADVIDVYLFDANAVIDRAAVAAAVPVGTLSDVMTGTVGVVSGNLTPEEGEKEHCIVLKMQESAGNEYQNLSAGGGFRVVLLATQYTYEEDSFGNDYDTNAEYPEFSFPNSKISETVSADVIVTEGKVDSNLALQGTAASAQIPEGVQVSDGANKLTLTVSDKIQSESNITLGENEALRALDVHIEGVDGSNTVPMEIYIQEAAPKGLNAGNLKLYHVENGVSNEMTAVDTFTAHNQFKYDPATGDVTLYMATFSEVAMVADTTAAWEGKFDYSWYDASKSELTIANADQLAGFGAIVGGMNGQTQDSFDGKTVKLIVDINLGDAEKENDPKLIFYPIGYYNNTCSYSKSSGGSVTSNVSSFEGTFDGQGHTIANFYQNTWEMFGDYNNGYSGTPNHYKDAMGLFGYVRGGKVKNLTVDNFSSDGEFTPTGVIAAYADGNSTFENIAITNCNPRVYNTGNGGIIGIAGDTRNTDDDHITLKNITVDNSNKISALWGSYDVACGGLVGMYRGNVDGSGNATGDTISFTNCHVAAQMDVYNDVCGNYQYYAYRYAGMIIGSIRHNTTDDADRTIPNMTGISATGCTVNYGDWNDYYYCEFEKNGHPSYSGEDDYKFSRVPHSELNFTDSNGNGLVDANERASVTGCKHNHTTAEDNKAIYLPFHQLFTGYSWGVSSIGLKEYSGIVTTLDITEGDQEESVEKFTVVPKMGDTVITENDLVVNISDLFAAKENAEVAINGSAVQVAVSAVGMSGITAEYIADSSDWTKGTLTFNKIEGMCTVTIQDYKFCKPTTFVLKDGKVTDLQKFAIVFPNVDKYLYRVGNLNSVSLSSLFKEADIAPDDAKVNVTVAKIAGNVESTYAANSTNWEAGTLSFTGTGVVTLTISEDGAFEKVLNLEVVDAWNTTNSMDATEKNVVLLNDISGGFTVKDGHAFYGNGFTVTCSGNGSYRSASVSYGFVTVNNGGILDNVQIICDIFPESYLYTNEMTAGSDGRYPYGYSAVVVSGNSTISNCYIYGARNNIQVGEGNITIENSVLECGSLSNIHILSSNGSTVTLRDTTTIQYPAVSSYNTSKVVMGFGVLVGTNESTSNPTIKLEGTLNQYNWVNSSHHTGSTAVSNAYAKTAITNALKVSDYQHKINGQTTVNMGIVFLNTLATDITSTDNRDNKTSIPYLLSSVSMSGYTGQVYSIKSTSAITAANGFDATTDGVLPYTPNANKVILPQISHLGANGSSLTVQTAYDDEWITTFCADLDKLTGGSYTFTFADLIVSKYGTSLEFTIKDANGDTVDKNATITLNALLTKEYTLTVTDDRIYNNDGQLSGISTKHSMKFVLYATKTSIDPPKFTGIGNGVTDSIRLVTSAGGNWRPAYPALEGVSVTYWSKSESRVKTVDLSTLTNKGIIDGKTWTYTCDDYTLTITGGPVHTNTSYVLSPMIATRDGKDILYFAGANKDNGTGTTARMICLEYVFTDKNASTTVGQATEYNNGIATVKYSELPEFSWSSFKNGTVEELSVGGSGGECVTPDTLVTLADGTQKEIQYVNYDDELLVWDFYKGMYQSVPAALIVNHGYGDQTIIELAFDDGTVVKAISAHSFFDADTNRWELMTEENAAGYIGHEFVQADGNRYTTVKLVDVDVYTEYTESYSLVSAYHYNFITENMFSLTNSVHNMVAGLEVGKDMTYDQNTLANDVAKYGLYTYADFADYINREQYVAFNGDYLKISVAKGYITFDEILSLIEAYLR